MQEIEKKYQSKKQEVVEHVKLEVDSENKEMTVDLLKTQTQVA